MTGKNKLLIFNIGMTLILILNTVFKFFNFYTYPLFLFVSFLSLRFIVGWEKDNYRYKKDSIMIIIIYGIFYTLFIYFIGLFLGFLKSPYNLSFIGIMKNMIPTILTIVFAELIRYQLVKKGRRYKLILVLTVFLMTFIDLALIIRIFDFGVGTDIVKFILVYLCTSLSKNVFLTYLTGKVGYKSSVVYRLLFEIPIYLLPITPDLGIYMDTIFKIVLPIVLTFTIYKLFQNKNLENNIDTPRKKIIKRTSLVVFALLMLTIVGLTCGWFKYYTMVIGSPSMTPIINKGDIAVTEKLNQEEISKLEIGDILVFNYRDKIVMHRIIEIDRSNNKIVFYTKGDFNEAADGYPIEVDDVIGTTKFRIKFLGYPTVWLNETIEKTKK